MSDTIDSNRFLFPSLKKGTPSCTAGLTLHLQVESVAFAHGKGRRMFSEWITWSPIQGHLVAIRN